MLELSTTGQCVELLAEIVKAPQLGLVPLPYGPEVLCVYCGKRTHLDDGTYHRDTCPIDRARKLLNIEVK